MICGNEVFTRNQTFLKNYLDNFLYLEGHHVLPMKAQDKYVKNIDNVWNVVPLCPKHHKEIHNIDIIKRREKLDRLLEKYKILKKESFFLLLKENLKWM